MADIAIRVKRMRLETVERGIVELAAKVEGQNVVSVEPVPEDVTVTRAWLICVMLGQEIAIDMYEGGGLGTVRPGDALVCGRPGFGP